MNKYDILNLTKKNGADDVKDVVNRAGLHIDSKIAKAYFATNKSFVEALGKVSANKEWGLSQDELDSFDDMEYYDRDYVHIIMEKLQRKLINDITKNNGKYFWSICSEFIGEDDE